MSLTNPWRTLPLDLWALVFDQVDSIKDVAACRLVCKAWDSLAERSMFKRDYRINTVAAQRKYYKQLVKKPALVPLVNSIYVLPNAEPGFYINLIKLVFRPHIKKIEGEIFWSKDEFNEELHNVSRRTAQEAGNYTLEHLNSPNLWSDQHVETFLFFKKTLVRLEFKLDTNAEDDAITDEEDDAITDEEDDAITDEEDDDATTDEEEDAIQMAILNRRREFESLKSIKLTIRRSPSLLQLEDILNKCSPIEQLEITLRSITPPILENQTLQEWLELHVIRDTSVRKLHLIGDGPLPCALFRYLLYKYPQLASMETIMDIDKIDPKDLVTNFPDISVLDDLKGLACSSINDWLVDSMKTLKRLVSSMESPKNTLRIRRHALVNNVFAIVDAKSFRFPSEITDFSINIRNDHSLHPLEEIISYVSNITSLDIAYGSCNDVKLDYHWSYLYPLLETIAPNIEKLTFQAMELHCPLLICNPPRLDHLVHLEFRDVTVDKLVLSTLSTMAPNLECLILSSCRLDTERLQDYHLTMPRTDFTRISIVTTSWIPCFDGMHRLARESDFKDGQMTTVQLTTLADQKTRHYVLKAGTPTESKQISLEEYNHIADFWPKTEITCKSIKYLKFDLGKLNIILNVEAGRGRIEPLDDWDQANRGFLLSWFHGN